MHYSGSYFSLDYYIYNIMDGGELFYNNGNTIIQMLAL